MQHRPKEDDKDINRYKILVDFISKKQLKANGSLRICADYFVN